MSNYKLRLSGLDKDQLKADFINYLQTTSEFQNFNPNASGMSSLLDLLAYNTYYQSLMANMLFNETFIDTATKRQNVVSRANELGYQPRSSRASSATLNVTVKNVSGNPTSLVLPAGSTFSTIVGNQPYTFTTIVPFSTTIQFDINNIPYYQFVVTAYEGILTQNTFLLSTDMSIDIPNFEMDTTTLRVFVTTDITEVEYYSAGNFLTVNGSNKVYFLSEGLDVFEMTFGDGTFGYKPPVGSSIRITYLVTSGDGANGASVFAMASTIPGATTASINVIAVAASQGGAAQETIDSIKANAVNLYKTQDRAVTPNDFRTLIIQSSNNVKDALVWGGQDNIPPKFGKVVACVLPMFGDSLTTSDKNNIKTIVSSKAVPNIGIEFIDPTYLNLVVDCTVTYDATVITLATFDLQTLVQNTVANFIQTNLTKFNGSLRYSNLVSAIDRSDLSIVSNVTDILLRYEYTPTFYQTTAIDFSFNNPIDNINKSYAMKSSLFYITGLTSGVWIEDDGNGILNIFYSKSGVKTYAAYNVGTINYQTGSVHISSINITGLNGHDAIHFEATPVARDIFSSKTTIIHVNTSDIVVSVQPS